jgi:hypothetical protein
VKNRLIYRQRNLPSLGRNNVPPRALLQRSSDGHGGGHLLDQRTGPSPYQGQTFAAQADRPIARPGEHADAGGSQI